MGYEFVTGGDRGDLESLPQYEGQIAEGQRGLMEFDLLTGVPDFVVTGIQSSLNAAGVQEANVSTTGNQLRIGFRKGFPPLAAIVAVLIVIAVIVILAWRLFKEIVPAGLQPLVGTLGIVVLLGLGVLVLYKAVRRKI